MFWKASFELNLACHTDTVLGDVWSAEFLLDNHVAAFGTECNLNGIGESVYTLFELFTSLYIEFNFFCHFSFVFVLIGFESQKYHFSITARMSL